jgi:predicted  nucleic acid-binding Zn-ribbon protein
MSVRQLYQLQCLDLEIQSAEQSSAQAQARLTENKEFQLAKTRLANSQSELDGLLQQQKENDWVISDITAKMAVASGSLYSGRVRNPKELTSLQQRDPLEEQSMTFMEKVEVLQANLKKLEAEFKAVETRLFEEHKTLHALIGELVDKLIALNEKRALVAITTPPDERLMYTDLKKRLGIAVTRIDRGTCGRCRISLSSSELQRARTGKLAQCSSCYRILFFE